MITDILPTLVIGALGFYKTRIYLASLGPEISGLIGTFTSVLAYLSLAEGGFGTALDYFFYKPLAEGNKDRIVELFNSSKRILMFVGMIIFSLACVFLLFVPTVGNYNGITDFTACMIFLLITVSVIIPYLTYQPYISLLTADQKRYKVNVQFQGFKVISMLASIGFVMVGMDILLVLLSDILINFILAFYVIRKVKKEYTYLSMHKRYTYEMLKMTKDSFVHRIAVTVTFNSDQIILSTILGAAMVPFYNNYNQIVNFIVQLINKLYGAITHSFGNVFASENREKQLSIFNETISITAYMSVLLSVIFVVSVKSFFPLWLHTGEKYVLGNLTVFLFGWYMFSTIFRKPLVILNDVNGMFGETRNVRILEAAFNIVFSIILIYPMGITGLLIATIGAHFFIGIIANACILYPKVFKRSGFEFIGKAFINFGLFLGLVLLNQFCIQTFNFYPASINMFEWFARTALLGVMNTMVVSAVFMLDKPFNAFVRIRVLGVIRRR